VVSFKTKDYDETSQSGQIVKNKMYHYIHELDARLPWAQRLRRTLRVTRDKSDPLYMDGTITCESQE